MTVFVINPNSTKAMTQSALAAARKAAPDIAFEGWTSDYGPAAIEGAEDGARAVPPLLDLVRQASDGGASAIILACFDDTGLEQAQKIAECPVIGIGQASYIRASLLSGPTAVVTTVKAAVPVIEANIRAQGQTATVTQVLAADVPVLMLDHDPQQAAQAFEAAARTLPQGIENIILGCSGAVTIVEEMRRKLSVNVIDGVTAAARLCRAFVD